MNPKWVALFVLVALTQAAYAHDLVDPTRPPWLGAVAPRAAAAHRGLTAVLLDGPRRLALIDGHLVGVGGRIGRERVVKIHHNTVVLTGRHGRRVMFLLAHTPNIAKAFILRDTSR